MIIDLTGLRAVVTGSTSGIGFAIIRGLAGSGAAVVINGRSQTNVDAAVTRLTKELPQAKVEGVVADLATAAGAAAFVAAGPGSRHPGQQPRHLRAETVRRDPRRRLGALLRDQRHERRAAVAPLPAGHDGELGPRRLHLQRDRPADPDRDDPLRDDQDGAARGIARPRRDRRRHRRHRERGAARADALRGRGRVRRASSRRSRGCRRKSSRSEFVTTNRPTSLLKRIATVEEVANMVVYVCSREASATTGAALRVDGGVVRSIA